MITDEFDKEVAMFIGTGYKLKVVLIGKNYCVEFVLKYGIIYYKI